MKIAVVVGYHWYDVCAFQEMFESFPGMHVYIQHLEQFTSSPKEVRESYDAIVFYVMRHENPVNDGPWYEGAALDALSELGEKKQGLVFLHHTLLAFENWPQWAQMTGFDPAFYQDYRLNVPMHIVPEKKGHPILAGIEEFDLTDEIYLCRTIKEEGLEVLLRTDQPENMSVTAWTKHWKNARVFCFQLGHDAEAFRNEDFRRILYQGIRWSYEG